MSPPRYVQFTATSNALDYLHRACKYIHETERNPLSWKWVVIAMHGALYGFAVCALKGTNPDRVRMRGKSGQVRNTLIDFDDALKRCQEPEQMYPANVMPIVLSPGQSRSIRILKDELRNNFAHLIPKAWSIEIHGMPRIAIDCLEVIEAFFDSGAYLGLEQSEAVKARKQLLRAKHVLVSSKLLRSARKRIIHGN